MEKFAFASKKSYSHKLPQIQLKDKNLSGENYLTFPNTSIYNSPYSNISSQTESWSKYDVSCVTGTLTWWIAFEIREYGRTTLEHHRVATQESRQNNCDYLLFRDCDPEFIAQQAISLDQCMDMKERCLVLGGRIKRYEGHLDGLGIRSELILLIPLGICLLLYLI